MKNSDFIKLYIQFLIVIVIGRLILQADLTFFSYLGNDYVQIFSYVNKMDLLTSIALLALMPLFISSASANNPKKGVEASISISVIVSILAGVFSYLLMNLIVDLSENAYQEKYKEFLNYTVVLIPLKFLLTALSISLFSSGFRSFVLTVNVLELVSNVILNWTFSFGLNLGSDGIYISTIIIYLATLVVFYFKLKDSIGISIKNSLMPETNIVNIVKSSDFSYEFLRLCSLYGSMLALYYIGNNYLPNSLWKEFTIAFEVLFIFSFISVSCTRATNIYCEKSTDFNKLADLFLIRNQALLIILSTVVLLSLVSIFYKPFFCLVFNHCSSSAFLYNFIVIFPVYILVSLISSFFIGFLHSAKKIKYFCFIQAFLVWGFYIPVAFYQISSGEQEGFWILVLFTEIFQLISLLLIVLRVSLKYRRSWYPERSN